MEDLEIPWAELSAIFIGGNDPWKDSKAAQDIAKTAVVLGVHSHIGRVNTIKRYKLYAELGANTCDGSGIAMYDHMLEAIARELRREPEPGLFDEEKVA
jgi:hydroxymethylglutaryl-CoA reductase